MKSRNILRTLLDELHVPHTAAYADTLHDTHPDRDNLYGLTDMLARYGIHSRGLRLDRDKLPADMPAPFVAQAGGYLIVVTRVADDGVRFLLDGQPQTVSAAAFRAAWSGVVLTLEATPGSIEPDYRAHRTAQRWQRLRLTVLGAAALLLAACGIARGPLPAHAEAWPVALAYAAGCVVSLLLLLKQLHVRSAATDRLCTMMRNASCDDVLSTDAARLPGGFSWSEVGATYFAVSLVALCAGWAAWPLLALLAAAALPYAVWSVWYQKFRAGRWCPLCLMVQLLFVVTALLYLRTGIYSHLAPQLPAAIALGAAYAAVLCALNSALAFVARARKDRSDAQAYSRLKGNPAVLSALLERQPAHPDGLCPSALVFGHPQAAHRVTVLSNPFCGPCAQMHGRLEALLGRDCCVQYVFTAFRPDLTDTNRRLIALYRQQGPARTWALLTDWFARGKHAEEAFFAPLSPDIAAAGVEDEYGRQERWVARSGFRGTPTLYLDGRQLPPQYSAEDLAAILPAAPAGRRG